MMTIMRKTYALCTFLHISIPNYVVVWELASSAPAPALTTATFRSGKKNEEPSVACPGESQELVNVV